MIRIYWVLSTIDFTFSQLTINFAAYEKSKTEGYCNEAAYILKYNDDLKFEVVEWAPPK